MSLETKLDNSIQKVISDYKKICSDINELEKTESKYFGEKTKSELLEILRKINKITNKEEKVKKEYLLYQNIRYHFATYIGFIISEELNINNKIKKILINEEFYTTIGNLIINDNL